MIFTILMEYNYFSLWCFYCILSKVFETSNTLCFLCSWLYFQRCFLFGCSLIVIPSTKSERKKEKVGVYSEKNLFLGLDKSYFIECNTHRKQIRTSKGGSQSSRKHTKISLWKDKIITEGKRRLKSSKSANHKILSKTDLLEEADTKLQRMEWILLSMICKNTYLRIFQIMLLTFNVWLFEFGGDVTILK